MPKFVLTIFLVLLVLVITIVIAFAQEPMRFVAIGDIPYTDEQSVTLDEQIVPAIKASAVPFVVHYGDVKAGGHACTDAVLTAARDRVLSLHDGPVFFTPGDNGWTDCDRRGLSGGDSVSELERLSYLRNLFYSAPVTAPVAWDYARQANFPENATWNVGGVRFATLHVVGTNNGRSQVFKDDVELALALVAARDHANRVWLTRTMETARRETASALVIISQADLTEPWEAAPCAGGNAINCDAFAALRQALKLGGRRFGGPMLFIHGDTSPYCWDKTFGGEKAPNLWRLNGPGDYAVIDAALVEVTPGASEPFAAETLLGKQAPDQSCN